MRWSQGLQTEGKIEEKQCFDNVLLGSDVVTTRPDRGKMKETQCFYRISLGTDVVTTPLDKRKMKEKTML